MRLLRWPSSLPRHILFYFLRIHKCLSLFTYFAHRTEIFTPAVATRAHLQIKIFVLMSVFFFPCFRCRHSVQSSHGPLYSRGHPRKSLRLSPPLISGTFGYHSLLGLLV